MPEPCGLVPAYGSSVGADAFVERVVDVPQPGSRLESTDTLVIAGFDADLQKLPR